MFYAFLSPACKARLLAVAGLDDSSVRIASADARVRVGFITSTASENACQHIIDGVATDIRLRRILCARRRDGY